MPKYFLYFFLYLTPIASWSYSFTTNAYHNVRSSINFYGNKNISGQVPPGVKLSVLSETLLPSGATALEIKVLHPAQYTSLNQKSPLYLWKSPKLVIHKETETEAKVTGIESCGLTCYSSPNPHIQTVGQQVLQAIEQTENESQKQRILPQEQPITFDFDAYSNNPKIERLVNNIIRRGSSRSNGKCYAYVKTALTLSKIVSERPAGIAAKNATENLAEHGFINLLDFNSSFTPDDAPRGAILVYEGGFTNIKACGGKCGHVEVKLDKGANARYGSDFIQRPAASEGTNRKHYKLVGIMVKPDLGD